MFRLIPTITILVSATPALAHPGHLAGLAGHDHWVAGAAIGLAIGISLWGALKGKPRSEDTASDDDTETDAEAEAA